MQVDVTYHLSLSVSLFSPIYPHNTQQRRRLRRERFQGNSMNLISSSTHCVHLKKNKKNYVIARECFLNFTFSATDFVVSLFACRVRIGGRKLFFLFIYLLHAQHILCVAYFFGGLFYSSSSQPNVFNVELGYSRDQYKLCRRRRNQQKKSIQKRVFLFFSLAQYYRHSKGTTN